jgi:hypothetical protein
MRGISCDTVTGSEVNDGRRCACRADRTVLRKGTPRQPTIALLAAQYLCGTCERVQPSMKQGDLAEIDQAFIVAALASCRHFG